VIEVERTLETKEITDRGTNEKERETEILKDEKTSL
jgi:hypothetical protein